MQRFTGPTLLLTALLAAPPPLIAQARHEDSKEKEQARQQIGITAAQQDAIAALFDDVEKQERPLRSRLRGLYGDLQQLYDSYEFDAKQARRLREEIVTQQKNLLTLYAGKEERLRRILTRVQFEHLRAQMKEGRDHSRREGHSEGRNKDK